MIAMDQPAESSDPLEIPTMPDCRTLAIVAPAVLALAAACSERSPTTAGEAPSEAAPVQGAARAADGVPIVYEARGEGRTAVVFVHCWACNRQFWRHQLEAVAAAGHRVVTLDLPGHGESGADRVNWSVRSLAGDVLAVVDALELDRVLLVGHSMGGPVSLEVAARDAGRVRGIACVDTLHNVEFEWPEGMTDRLTAGLEADFRAGIESFVPQLFKPGADAALVQWVIDQGSASDPAATIGLMRDFASLDMPAMLSAAGVPIRCINAAPDDGRGMVTQTAVNRRYADFDVVLMEGVGHYPQLEQPVEFNERLLGVLAGLAD